MKAPEKDLELDDVVIRAKAKAIRGQKIIGLRELIELKERVVQFFEKNINAECVERPHDLELQIISGIQEEIEILNKKLNILLT
jgi:hypothetical protein